MTTLYVNNEPAFEIPNPDEAAVRAAAARLLRDSGDHGSGFHRAVLAYQALTLLASENLAGGSLTQALEYAHAAQLVDRHVKVRASKLHTERVSARARQILDRFADRTFRLPDDVAALR